MLVRRTPAGERQDLTPAPFNVRTRVHEYGGGAYVVRDGVIVAANFADQRLYRIDQGDCAASADSRKARGQLRYADLELDLRARPDPRGPRGPSRRRRGDQRDRRGRLCPAATRAAS